MTQLREKYARDFERLEALIEFSEQELKMPNLRFEPEFSSLFYTAILAFWVKAFKTAKSIVLLCEHGFGTDSNILLRTLIETTISGKYLCLEDQDERAVWYASYGAIQQKHLQGILRKGRYKKIRDSIDPDSDIELQDIYDATVRRRNAKVPFLKRIRIRIGLILSRWGLMSRYWPWATTWSGKSVPRMAKAVGLPTFYDLPYQLVSPIIHATDPTNHVELLDPQREDPTKGIRFNVDPDENHIDNALVTAALCLGELMQTVYKILQLKRQDELEVLCKECFADIKST